MKQDRQNRSKIWQRHIEAAESYPGSIHKYCTHRGISESSFYYWQKKFGTRAKSNSASEFQSAFLPVIVSQTPTTKREETLLALAFDQRLLLPDARWVAEFVRHLFEVSRGVR